MKLPKKMGEIEELRKEIDRIDDSLLALLLQRKSIVEQIGKLKKINKLNIFDKNREQQILKKIEDFSKKHNISNDDLSDIFKKIMDYSKKVQGGMK